MKSIFILIILVCLLFICITNNINHLVIPILLLACLEYVCNNNFIKLLEIHGGKGRNTSKVSLAQEYYRYQQINLIIESLHLELLDNSNKNIKINKRVKYESANITERLLLSYANNAWDNKLKDPILNIKYDYTEYENDIKYQIKKKQYLNNDINLQKHITDIKHIIKNYIYSNPTFIPCYSIDFNNDLAVVKIGTYERKINASRMKLLLQISDEKNVINMLMRYACIISGPQHWEAPIEYFRILYKIGVRFEGFSSPVNSNFLLEEFKDTNICSLFYDTDKHFRSLGSFFSIDFLEYKNPMIVVGPPYYDELILKIAQKIQHTCKRAKSENRCIRFIITHSNSWDYSAGFSIFKQSEFLSFDHVFKKNEHYYNNDKGDKIISRFETRLFVMEYGMDIKPHINDLLNIFPSP